MRLLRKAHQIQYPALAEALMSRYREPLVRAAYDLQSRLFNILRQDQRGFLAKYVVGGDPKEQEYARENTLHVP